MPAELARPYADAFGLCVVPRGDDTLTPAARLLVEHLEASGRCDGNKFE